MPPPDNTSMNEMTALLQQMKELHAPDRCEGPANYVWHGLQKMAKTVTRSTEKTPQEKIEDFWKGIDLETRRTSLKKLTGVAQRDFKNICHKVDGPQILQITQTHQNTWDTTSNPQTDEEIQTKQYDLNLFITRISDEKVQSLFDKLIVTWEWRRRMIVSWQIH